MAEGDAQRRVRVKICGVTGAHDARLATELGADYLGLNFYPGSPRFVDVGVAREIAQEVRGEVELVGVFVNTPRQEVARLADAASLDLLQFHGDEAVTDVAPFAGRAIKVFRPSEGFSSAELEPYGACWGFLFDTPNVGLYGGSGESWAYDRIAPLTDERPIFVAGGVGPENVRRLIVGTPRLFGVDICSSVESAPGEKDRGRLEELFAEIRAAEALAPA